MNVFLTGGTGFIGKPLTQRLVSKHGEVSVLVRSPDSPAAQRLKAMGANLVTGDVLDPESMRAGMKNADLVIHNAGWYEFGVTREAQTRMHDINVVGTENVLRVAHELEIPRVVHVSSCVAFGATGPTVRDEQFVRNTACRTVYEQTKTDAHAIAQRYQTQGSPVIIVCPGQVIGPNDHSSWGYFARLYVNGIMPPMAWGKNVRIPQVEVTDLAEGIALAGEKGSAGELYHLSGEPVSIGEVLTLWNTLPGGLKMRMWMPSGVMAVMVQPMEPLQRWLGISAFLSRETVMAAVDMLYTHAKAERELDWHPRKPLAVWPEIIEAEHRLKSARRNGGLAAKLNPLPDA